MQERITVPCPRTGFDSRDEFAAILMLVLISVFIFRYATKAGHRH